MKVKKWIICGTIIVVIGLIGLSKHIIFAPAPKTNNEIIVKKMTSGTQKSTTASNTQNQEANSVNPLPDYKVIEIALSAVTKQLKIPARIPADIKCKGYIAIITWFVPGSTDPNKPRTPGPDYYARVKVDRFSGSVLEILAGSQE